MNKQKTKQNKKNEKQYRGSYNTFPTRFRVLVNNTIYERFKFIIIGNSFFYNSSIDFLFFKSIKQRKSILEL
jgi:hypothetical protein